MNGPAHGDHFTAECRIDEHLHHLAVRGAQLTKAIRVRVVGKIQRLTAKRLKDGKGACFHIDFADGFAVDGHLQPLSTADLLVVVCALTVQTAAKVPFELRMVAALELTDAPASTEA
jgi:hypothetical protein